MTVETRDEGQPASGWLRRVGGYLGRHRRSLVIAIVAAVLGAATQVATPLVARQIIDEVIVAQAAPLWPWIVGLLVLAVLGFVFTRLRRFRGGRIALDVQHDLRVEMHDALQGLDQGTLSRISTGQLVGRATSDIGMVQGLLTFLPLVLGNVLSMVMSIVVMFVLSPLLGLVSLAMVPVLLWITIRMRVHTFPASWDAQQKEGELVQIVDEDVAGVRVVKAFGQEQRELERLTASAVRLYGSQMRITRLIARYQPLLSTVPVLGQVAVLALGGWLAITGTITLGTFLAFSTYIAALMAPTRQLAGILTIAEQARAGFERIFELIDLRPAITDRPDAVALAEPAGEIRLDDVVFGYDDDSRVLDGVTLRIAPGERVAIVGASGSGKSTIAGMLMRAHDPDSGTVSIGGVDLRRARLDSIRGAVGMVFEDAFLFSESVRENIRYGDPAASDEQIEDAARSAAAHEFITALPHGYDTVVGERGLSLSGGQRQRIALARALVRDPSILVLDDATSAIDARTEQQIHDALLDAAHGRTVVIVAHRHSTLRLAERIVVLDGGRIVDEGTHDELAERSDVYRALFGATDAARRGEVEALAPAAVAGVEVAAGPRFGLGAGAPRPLATRAPDIGPGLGGGRSRGIRGSLVATPELLEKVAALPPVKDEPEIDLAAESSPRPGFSLRAILREFRRPLLFAFVFVVLDAVAGLLGPAAVKAGIDQGVSTGAAGILFAASGAYLLITIADLFARIAGSFFTGRAAQRIMLSLRVRIFAQLQRLSLDYYEREMAGRIMTRMTTDIDQFDTLLANGLLGALVSFVTFVGVGVALVVIDVPLGLAVLTVVVPLAIATVFFRRRAAELYAQSRERISIVNAAFQESLSGVREAQAFTHEEETRRRFRRQGEDYLESRVAAQRLVATYFPFVQFLSSVADAIVLCLGALLIAQGQLTAGALIAFLLYIDMFFSPIQQLSQVFDSWQQTRVSVTRIDELMRLQTLTPEAPDATPVGRLTGRLDLERVHFAYPTGAVSSDIRGPQDARGAVAVTARPAEALAGVDLDIRAGETIALVGETGAGKSTVMKLVARFYDPDRGAVRADGRDLRTLELAGFRRTLGYVPQESFLFSGTVASNIAYGRPDADADAVEAAARAVGAHEMIRALPRGYDTEIAERGRSLSAGQRQLLTLARAELVNPRILLLDEATSNLDLASEARVTDAMQRLSAGRTTVLIAHRLQTAMGADRIVLLDHGRVRETGSHDELLASDGAYARMWRAFESATA
ncbi:ABC transporter ATP-binding protein [Microbacterium sp. SORGH_AS_0888]|uniref:ABC transporter ATP-binding protein n=1 Tax=Microbacterium sp. SORGH_AS_0888 TaxID=3041791 RepID=UPI002781D835|nr:ABC transporter ATP-binding protein [Microbacterium sp. SORGH_AS_0888]MDQ1130576.1 ATP-binding cassette subfamily B protein [Microbacterium sp. SORGH_AS_0888]